MALGIFKKLKAPTIKEKTLEFSPKKDEQEIIKRLGLIDLGVSFSKPDKIYSLGETFIVYSQKQLYYFDGQTFTLYTDKIYESAPVVLQVKKEGQERILIIYNGEGFIPELNQTVSQNSCKDGIYTYGRLVLVSDYEIFMSYPYSYEQVIDELTTKDAIKIEKEHGKILRIFALNDKVLIVTENSLLTLSNLFNETFSFKKVETEFIKVQENSVQKIGKYVYFISLGKIVKTDGNNVITLKDAGINKNIENSVGVLGRYFFKEEMEEYCGFNETSKELTCCDVEYFSDKGDYAYSNEKYYKITQVETENVEKEQSTELVFNFDSAKKKTLLELEVISLKSGEMVIKGDFGTVKYPLIKGLNLTRCNLCSKEFKISLADSPEKSVEKIILTYRIFGGK